MGFFLALTIVFFLAEALTAVVGAKNPILDMARIDIVSPQQFSTISTEARNIDDELGKLKVEVSPLIKNENDDFQKALIIKEWVMNQVSEAGLGVTAMTPYAILTEMHEGKSATCGKMSLLYWGALKSVGMDARLIQLIRSVYNKDDTHVAVEVFINGEWIVIDPFFNVYFLVDGKPASAVELQQLFLKNERIKDFQVVQGGKVSYPVKYDTYPLDPITFYNNVFVFERSYAGAWQNLPLVHYYFGNVYVMEEYNGSQADGEVKMHDYLVLAYDFYFPIGFGISFIALMALVFIRPKRNDRNSN